MKFISTDINETNTWQIGTGDPSRSYISVFLKFGVALDKVLMDLGANLLKDVTKSSRHRKITPDRVFRLRKIIEAEEEHEDP